LWCFGGGKEDHQARKVDGRGEREKLWGGFFKEKKERSNQPGRTRGTKKTGTKWTRDWETGTGGRKIPGNEFNSKGGKGMPPSNPGYWTRKRGPRIHKKKKNHPRDLRDVCLIEEGVNKRKMEGKTGKTKKRGEGPTEKKKKGKKTLVYKVNNLT